MTATQPTTPALPVDRDLFDPPPGLADFPAVSPTVFPSGADGWVVTSHAVARSVLADDRFSADRYHAAPIARADRRRQQQGPRTDRGMFVTADPPDHTRYRKLLTGQFTVRRMKQLEPRIEQIVTDHLDSLAQQQKPADLVAEFALPVPSLVICELLGIDYGRRAEFQEMTSTILALNTPPEELRAVSENIRAFMQELVTTKRGHPDDALISGLIADTDLDDEELRNIAFLLLLAGHETTANMLGLGTFALLQHPEQLRTLRENPDLMPGAVEELLRYLTIVNFVAVRVATEDLTLDGVAVKAGDTVLLALPTANRDAELTEHPDRLDVTRERTHHLAFGHGIHQCLGQQLARVEMQIGFRQLLERFPTLRLAVAPEDVPLRTDMTIYGVHALPVTW